MFDSNLGIAGNNQQKFYFHYFEILQAIFSYHSTRLSVNWVVWELWARIDDICFCLGIKPAKRPALSLIFLILI